MALPPILLVVPLLLAGMYLPAAGSAPAKPPAGAIGMVHEAFSTKEVEVRCGDTLTTENSSRWTHIIGSGQDGLLVAEAGVPVVRRRGDAIEASQSTTSGCSRPTATERRSGRRRRPRC